MLTIVNGVTSKQVLANEIINLFGMSAIKAHFPAYQQGDYFDKLVEKFEIYLEDELQRRNIPRKASR